MLNIRGAQIKITAETEAPTQYPYAYGQGGGGQDVTCLKET